MIHSHSEELNLNLRPQHCVSRASPSRYAGNIFSGALAVIPKASLFLIKGTAWKNLRRRLHFGKPLLWVPCSSSYLLPHSLISAIIYKAPRPFLIGML